MSKAGSGPSPGRGRRRRRAIAGNYLRASSSFVGRVDDLRELKTTLERSRLVTLVGPGGIGKSRLAREFVDRFGSVFTGGVWIVELAEVGGTKGVALAVARTLGLFEHTAATPTALIANALGPNTLLVLDNCEHVIDASAKFAAALLVDNATVRILATSREPLEISAENRFAVAPLAVPEASDKVSVRNYERYAAVELFVDRVLSKDRTFRVTEDNLPSIVSICSNAGGIPLAVELSAGRASLATLATLASQKEEQLGFESRARDASQRHRSMRVALSSSYAALSSGEQELWRRLSIFPRGATASTLRSSRIAAPLAPSEIEHSLEVLIERSIAFFDPSPPEGRYRLLEPIRLFGLEEARRNGEIDQLHNAYLTWCCELIPADAWVTGKEQLRWMRVFQAEHASIAAALDFCLEERVLGPAQELFVATFMFWGLSGWNREASHYGEALLEAVGTPSRWRTIIASSVGTVNWYNHEIAVRWFEEAHRTAGRNLRGRGLAQRGLGYCAMMSGSHDRAVELLESACELLEESEAPTYLAQARYALSQTHAFGRHDLVTARAVIQPNLERLEADDMWNRGLTHLQLGLIDWREGDLETAERHLRESLDAHAELRCLWAIAASLEYLGWVAASKGESERSALLLGYASSRFSSIGMNLIPTLTGDHGNTTVALQKRLGSERHRALTRTGASLTEDEVVAIALRSTAVHGSEPSDSLTPRELEVAEIISTGATNSQISAELLISLETVKTHVRSILNKLDLDSRVQIAAWYKTR